jgi:Ca2+-binding EF-hand superfamily protein
MTDIGSCYQPKNHPDVKYGRTTVSTLLSDFFETFNTVTNNGYVTLEQFLEYYANAAFYESDQEFEESMGAVWKVDNTTGNNSSVGNSSSNLPGKSLKDIAKARDKGDTMSSSQQGGRSIAPLEELRRQLAARGASGIIGLARKFRIMDDDGSKSLSMAEFKKGVRECSLDLNEQELNQLFQHFDKDRSGSLDYDEFLRGLRVKNSIITSLHYSRFIFCRALCLTEGRLLWEWLLPN